MSWMPASLREPLAHHVLSRSRARGGVPHPGLPLGERDQLGERGHAGRRMHCQHDRLARELDDRREVLHRIEGELVEMGARGKRVRRREHHVAVGAAASRRSRRRRCRSLPDGSRPPPAGRAPATSRSLIALTTMSVEPPGENAITMRIGLDGQAWACAPVAAKARQSGVSVRKKRLNMVSSLCRCGGRSILQTLPAGKHVQTTSVEALHNRGTMLCNPSPPTAQATIGERRKRSYGQTIVRTCAFTLPQSA